MTKIYIAGKISGDQNYKAKFEAARQLFDQQGFIVLDPSRLPAGMRREDYMRICLAMIDTADVVAFLPDYKNSDGAGVEYEYCRYIGKEIICIKNEYWRDYLQETYSEKEKQNGTH